MGIRGIRDLGGGDPKYPSPEESSSYVQPSLLDNMMHKGIEKDPGELLLGAQKTYPWRGIEPLNQSLDPGWEPMMDMYIDHGPGIDEHGQPYQKLQLRPWTGFGNEHLRPLTNPNHPEFRKPPGGTTMDYILPVG